MKTDLVTAEGKPQAGSDQNRRATLQKQENVPLTMAAGSVATLAALLQTANGGACYQPRETLLRALGDSAAGRGQRWRYSEQAGRRL